MRLIMSVIGAFLLLLSTHSFALSEIPDALLRVAVQQRQDGKLDRAYHLLELACYQGLCILTSVSLNQCRDAGLGKEGFPPIFQRTSTREGNLRVQFDGNAFIVEETGMDIGGSYVNNFRFGVGPLKQGGIAGELANFSGAFVKQSIVLKRVITVEYVPLPRGWQVVKLDCGVLLPGLERR